MFITSRDGKLFEGDKEYKAIGCNMYELAYVDTSATELMIKDAVEEGFKVIRFWAFQPVEKEKIHEICDLAKGHKMRLVPVLADKWGYLQKYKIDDEWYRENYKISYIPYIKELAEEFKDREEILLWELINEPVNDSIEVFCDFIRKASDEFKKVNSNHLLSLGTVGGVGDKFGGELSRFRLKNFKQLYSIPMLDVISLHDYSYDSAVFERLDMLYRFKGDHYKAKAAGSIDSFLGKLSGFIDRFFLKKFNKLIAIPGTLRWLWKKYNKKNIKIAKELNKPVYIGEIGFKKQRSADRKNILTIDIKKKFEMGISVYLLWSFEAQGWSNDGHDYGFKKSEFGEIVKVLNAEINK